LKSQEIWCLCLVGKDTEKEYECTEGGGKEGKKAKERMKNDNGKSKRARNEDRK
jgi:hypothetical protein